MLSLVIPIYRSEAGIPTLLAALEALAERIGDGLEVIFVVDGSPDSSYTRLQDALPRCSFPSDLVLLSRNFGSFAAIRAGLARARGETMAVMAADLQEPPELVERMHAIVREDAADVVVAQRVGRDDPWLSRLSSNVFWALYRRFVVHDMPVGGVDVFACNKTFRDALLRLQEHHTSLVAQIFWLGYRRTQVDYKRQKRRHGKSSWTWSKKWTYFMDSIFSFTDLPIRLLTYAGAGGALLSGAFILLVAVCRLLGLIAAPGYAATISMVVFFGSANFFATGVVGSYAWRAYENTKSRPLNLVLRAQSFPGCCAQGTARSA